MIDIVALTLHEALLLVENGHDIRIILRANMDKVVNIRDSFVDVAA